MSAEPSDVTRALKLWRRYWAKRDIVSRNALLLEYEPLVCRAVRHLPDAIRAAADDDDLYSFGLFGLIDAIEKCDENADPRRFCAYASYRIRGTIIDELRRIDWVPRSTRRLLVAYRTATDELSSTLGRTPRHAEVCASLQLSDDASLGVLQAASDSRIVSLNFGVDEDANPGQRVERAIEDDSIGPEDVLLLAERRADLSAAIARLSERQRQVIALRFLGGLTQRQIAAILDITTARVCQLESAALRALRKIFDGDLTGERHLKSVSSSRSLDRC